MIVAVAVVVIAGELGLSLYLIISVSTYAGVREQRARGRNVSDINAANGNIRAMCHLAPQDDTSLILSVVALSLIHI